MIYDGKNKFTEWRFSKEQDLEDAIQKVRSELFGSSRLYLEIKKLIGKKGGQMNIPDAYVLDLSSAKAPKLFVVENELSSHDHLRHIAVQILQFSLAFETNPHRVKEVLRGALKADPTAEARVHAYATANGFENIDYLLEQMVHRKEAFNALVIIDATNDELENILKEKFRFPVEAPKKITMKLSAIRLTNFQCFGPDTQEITFEDSTTMVIGPNGSGKTAILQALSRMFDANPGRRRVRKDDFHVGVEEEHPPEERSFTIEADFMLPEAASDSDAITIPPCFNHMRLDEEGAVLKVRFRLEATMGANDDTPLHSRRHRCDATSAVRRFSTA